MIAELLCVLSFMACCLVTGYLFGINEGERRGENAEWCRQYFERLEKEKARRRANGQFKSKSEITTK